MTIRLLKLTLLQGFDRCRRGGRRPSEAACVGPYDGGKGQDQDQEYDGGNKPKAGGQKPLFELHGRPLVGLIVVDWLRTKLC